MKPPHSRKTLARKSAPVQEPLPSPEEAHARLMTAVRDKLRLGIEGPLTPNSLMLLERTIKLARQMLILGKDPKAMTLEDTLVATGFPGYDLPLPAETAEVAAASGGPSPSAITSAEQFGAQAIRAIATGIGGPRRSPEPTMVDMVHAIAEARKEGMDDVADALRAQLRTRTIQASGPVKLLRAGGKASRSTTTGKKSNGKSNMEVKAS